MNRSRAFTLIELLVVIAIIGILSAVVLASLGVARERAREASIRATLKNMGAEIELLMDTNGGNYNFVNSCTSTSSPLNKFVAALQVEGAQVACDSFNVSTSGIPDPHTRWGVTALLSGSATPLVAFAASQEGVIKFDDANTGSTQAWASAVSACATIGKRLPTPEQLRSLYQASGNTTPSGFTASNYWSGVAVPAVSGRAYIVGMHSSGGDAGGSDVINPMRVRCGS